MTPAHEMSAEEYRDLLSELRENVRIEFVALWEVPLGITDILRDGNKFVHGPWLSTDCSRILTRWLEMGLLSIYWCDNLATDTREYLPYEGAHRLLAATERWTIDESANHYVSMTDKGRATSYQDWFDLVPRPTGTDRCADTVQPSQLE